MTSTVTAPGAGTGLPFDVISGNAYPKGKIAFGIDGVATDISSVDPLPVTLGLTDTQLRATAVPVSGTFYQATQPVSASALPLPTGAATETTLSAASGKLPSTLGQKTGAASMAVVPASDVLAPTKYPNATTATITSVQTNATGSTYTAFASLACTALSIVNTTGTALEYRRGATGTSMAIPDGMAYLITGITNASQIDVRRVDVSNTQVTLKAEALT